MLTPLQSNYTTLLSLLTRLIGQVLSSTVTPMQKVFTTMSTLPQWNRVDLNAVHSLPSEYVVHFYFHFHHHSHSMMIMSSFLMPIGEHLLKIVEQLEIVTSSTSDSLAAFRAVIQEELARQSEEGNSSSMEKEWKSVGTELERYGGQKERSSLNKAELLLKEGVVGIRP